ncbi:hypothetical protein B0H13DRAFT_2359364 [Mycena leptocephala]|nr:hypothetical protein B0H13DRAFT_2359364 [Mycena leptocephala]
MATATPIPMPASGDRNAPQFDATKPHELRRYFSDLEYLFTRSSVTDDTEKKHATRFLSVDDQEIREALKTAAACAACDPISSSGHPGRSTYSRSRTTHSRPVPRGSLGEGDSKERARNHEFLAATGSGSQRFMGKARMGALVAGAMKPRNKGSLPQRFALVERLRWFMRSVTPRHRSHMQFSVSRLPVVPPYANTAHAPRITPGRSGHSARCTAASPPPILPLPKQSLHFDRFWTHVSRDMPSRSRGGSANLDAVNGSAYLG